MRLLPLIATLTLAAASPAHAGHSTVADPGEIRACLAIADPLERVGCYDQLFGDTEDDAVAPATPPSADKGEANPVENAAA